MNKLLSELNPAQREAVCTIDGPLLVLAGAGTGKTRVITYRIAHMLESGIPPEAILGMTFTNKAAREMVERVGALVSDRVASKVTLGTFHSFCCRVLRKEISRIGFTPNFTIAADADQQGILRQAVAECGFAHDELSTEALASVIGREKNAMRGASEFLRHADTPFQVKAGHVYERYQQILLNQNMLDFDDILLFVVKIWEDDPACLEAYQARFSHILVDEYQDTNRVQFRLLELLSGKRHNLCVVGDDDQSIYSWRGARVEHILDFPLHFSDAKVVKLEQNYRSTNTILDAANQAISANRGRHEKNLWSEIGEGDPIRIVKLDHDGAAPGGEADFIGDAIQEYLGTGGPERRPQDIAVLYRSNYLSRQIEEAFRSKRIPYRIVGSRSFYQRKEILDAVAYLKLAVNPKDDQSLLRILGTPPRGIGDKAIEELKKIQRLTFQPFVEILGDESFRARVGGKAAESARELSRCVTDFHEMFQEAGALYDRTKAYLNRIGYMDGFLRMYKKMDEAEKRLENVDEFLNSIAEFEQRSPIPPTLIELIERYSLMDDNDKVEEEKSDSVTLMTIHAAKGLEFPCVILVGLEQGLFPHERAMREMDGVEEERRLFYVAMTRAKRDLYITFAGERYRYGSRVKQIPSEFLSLLPEGRIDKTTGQNFFKPISDEEQRVIFEGFYKMFEAGRSREGR